MRFGNIEIRLGANEVVIGAVVIFTGWLIFKDTAIANADLFKQGFCALIAWGAGHAMGKNQAKGE